MPEIKKINNYIDMLMEMYQPISEAEMPYAELNKLKAWELKQMVENRNLKLYFNNKKGGNIFNLRHKKPQRNKLLAGVLDLLGTHISRYGNDGMGDKPKGMCRVEYWLGHIDPDRILYNKIIQN